MNTMSQMKPIRGLLANRIRRSEFVELKTRLNTFGAVRMGRYVAECLGDRDRFVLYSPSGKVLYHSDQDVIIALMRVSRNERASEHNWVVCSDCGKFVDPEWHDHCDEGWDNE